MVVANTIQVTALSARLSDLDVTINTMNSHQGAEYLATVVVSPLAGHQTVGEFNLNLGRPATSLDTEVGKGHD